MHILLSHLLTYGAALLIITVMAALLIFFISMFHPMTPKEFVTTLIIQCKAWAGVLLGLYLIYLACLWLNP